MKVTEIVVAMPPTVVELRRIALWNGTSNSPNEVMAKKVIIAGTMVD